MKTPNLKKCLTGVLFVGLAILMGCNPSIHNVIKVLAPVSLGASRSEIRNVLVAAYDKKYSKNKYAYDLSNPPVSIDDKFRNSFMDMLAACNTNGYYTYIYPSDLFDKIQTAAFTDTVSLIAEAEDGNGRFNILYDSHTNYLGVFAWSAKRVR